jgi:hypothetical protein
VNVFDVRCECERGLECARGAMRATAATAIVAILDMCDDIVSVMIVLRSQGQ